LIGAGLHQEVSIEELTSEVEFPLSALHLLVCASPIADALYEKSANGFSIGPLIVFTQKSFHI
jgi:hypothetical protein